MPPHTTPHTEPNPMDRRTQTYSKPTQSNLGAFLPIHTWPPCQHVVPCAPMQGAPPAGRGQVPHSQAQAQFKDVSCSNCPGIRSGQVTVTVIRKLLLHHGQCGQGPHVQQSSQLSEGVTTQTIQTSSPKPAMPAWTCSPAKLASQSQHESM